MKNPTKYCSISVMLQTGALLRGVLHAPVGIEAKTRPADFIRSKEGGFLLLTGVEEPGNPTVETSRTLLIRSNAIAYIELPEGGWNVQQIDGHNQIESECFSSN